MAFDYYHRLGPRGQAVYRASDRLTEVALEDAVALQGLAAALEARLDAGRRSAVREGCQRLADALTRSLDVAPVQVAVLDRRPRRSDCELYGFYERQDAPGASPDCHIRLWMRTAHYRRVVAFRTFLRTLLHELCHHLDYELYRLPDSLHTEGFFRRTSSLFHQLVPRQRQAAAAGA